MPIFPFKIYDHGVLGPVYQYTKVKFRLIHVFRGDMNMCIRLTSYGSIHVPDRERGSPAEINSEL